MWQRNNGHRNTSELQNQFTAYLASAIRRKKAEYKKRQWKREKIEISTAFHEDDSLLAITPDMLEDLPLQMQIENMELFLALKQLSDRDLYILLAKALDGRPLSEIAAELGMGYSGTASAYERAVRRVRKGKGILP